MSPNNPLQRSAPDKVPAHSCLAGIGISGYAPPLNGTVGCHS
jgi:hypothetical protein